MWKRIFMCIMIVMFLVGCGGDGGSKNDPMKDWGTKKSTAKPLQDFPGGPSDKK